MRKSTILLMVMALALALIPFQQQTVVAALHPLRRSRFLNAKFPPPPPPTPPPPPPPPSCSTSSCKKQSPGSPGVKCCLGTCVDTDYSFQHCGNCNNACMYAQTCCQGKCVNTFTDDKNCGGCGVKCRTKCTNGFCDYAA